MVAEGIQSKKLSQIRSVAGDKPTSGVDAENKLDKVYGKKYRINLDHQVLTDHGVFYPQALYTAEQPNKWSLDLTQPSSKTSWQHPAGV